MLLFCTFSFLSQSISAIKIRFLQLFAKKRQNKAKKFAVFLYFSFFIRVYTNTFHVKKTSSEAMNEKNREKKRKKQKKNRIEKKMRGKNKMSENFTTDNRMSMHQTDFLIVRQSRHPIKEYTPRLQLVRLPCNRLTQLHNRERRHCWRWRDVDMMKSCLGNTAQ